MMTSIKFLVKRIPCVGYTEEVYWISSRRDENKVKIRLMTDKNIVDYRRIS